MPYTLGVDFGTLSARAVVLDTANGAMLGTATMPYPHGVMDRTLATGGAMLPPDYALQDPRDYLTVLEDVIPRALASAGLAASALAGVGIDFTCCTLLPLEGDGTPVCTRAEFAATPLAYALLWKHHAAKPYADRLTEVARERGEAFLARCGGVVDEEWTLAKLCQVMEEAPAVFDAAACFAEAGDWIVWQLTGKLCRSYHFAAYKSHYDDVQGYPSEEYLAAVDARLPLAVREKLAGDVHRMGSCAGYVTPTAAARFGLAEGTPVAVAMPDGHVAAPAVGVCRAGDMFMVLGTSGCFMTVGERDLHVPGICGTVKDGILPGLYGFEAGLCSLGDHFAYAARNLISAEYATEAQQRGLSPLQLLLEKAEKKRPGESGVLALNWFNGNRSILVDGALSGAFVGLTLQSAPEDLLRALLEATAFGARNIIENFERHGVGISRILASGGIAHKDPFTMQLYADVLGREIAVTQSTEAPAQGVAICAAVAAGLYADMTAAVEAMHAPVKRIYTPNGVSFDIYSALYAEYKRLHDYFGRGENGVMRRLRQISKKQREG